MSERCTVCGSELSPGDKFCVECGSPVPKKKKFCTECGAPLAGGAKFCTECGTPLTDGEKTGAERGAKVAGEAGEKNENGEERYPAFLLITEKGETEASEKSIADAVFAAAADGDEYVKLSPSPSLSADAKPSETLIAYRTSDADGPRFSIQVVINERKERYDACYEKEGFTVSETLDIFLGFAKTAQISEYYLSWGRL